MANLINFGGGAGGGSSVTPNPQGAATDTLVKLGIEGTIYDFAGGGSTHNYSTTEQVVGTWIDGKTLYEKTINFGALPNRTTKSVPHGISNLGVVISGFGVSSDGTNSLVLPYVNSSSDRVGIYFDSTNANVVTSTDISAYTETYLTVQYTKA